MCDPCCGTSCTPFCDPCEFDMKSKPRELKGGMYTKCDCIYRNGLQDSCLREDCKRPKRDRTMKQIENSFDIERTISNMTQPQTISMPQHVTMSKLGNGQSFNGLSDFPNQSGGMGQILGSYFAPQSYPLNQQLAMNSMSSPQYSTQEGQSFMPTSQQYNGVAENSVFSSIPAADGTTLSPTGMGAMGMNNMFSGLGNSMGNAMGNSMGNAMGNSMGNNMGSLMSSGMPTMTSFNGMGGGGGGGVTNMNGMGNMHQGMSGMGGLSGMNAMAAMGNMAGMGGSGGMSNLGGGMPGTMNSSGMASGGGMYQSYPMSGFGDGQGQPTMSQCY